MKILLAELHMVLNTCTKFEEIAKQFGRHCADIQ